MGEQPYKERDLTQYLLGSLHGPEAERLDELSLTDDAFADALRAAEKDLIDAYVQGEVTGAELERFEAHYLASPIRREGVRFARAFHDLAAREAAAAPAGAQDSGTEESKRKARVRSLLLNFFSARRPAWHTGLAAAALVLLAAGVWLALEGVRRRQEAPQLRAAREENTRPAEAPPQGSGGPRESDAEKAAPPDVRALPESDVPTPDGRQSPAPPQATKRKPSPPRKVVVASFVLTPQVRGAGEIRTVSVPAGAGEVAMRLELEPNDYSVYSVALLGQPGGRPIWRSGRLRAGDAGGVPSVNISFSAALLRPGTYVLRAAGVSADGQSEIIGDYPLRVVK